MTKTGSVFGFAPSPQGQRFFLWTKEQGSIGLGPAFNVRDGRLNDEETALVAGPFRWTKAGGVTQFIPPVCGVEGSAVNGESSVINGDGSVIVVDFKGRAFRTGGTGFSDIGTLGGATRAMAIDNSGTIIAGNSELPGTDNPPITHAFRWTPEGMVDLGTLGGRNSKVSGMSRDGSVIVGMADGRAFRWTKAGGMTDLSTFEAAPFVSSDGSVVAGGKGGHVFRWTAQTGVVDLKVDAPGFPAGMSSDGSVLVFFSVNGAALKSLHRWTLAEGAQDVLAMLRESGEDMTRITLNIPVKLSANGKYVLALGTFPDGTAQPIVIEFVD